MRKAEGGVPVVLPEPRPNDSISHHDATSPHQDNQFALGLRRRACAARRIPPLPDGVTDPWGERHLLDGPGSFGLTPREIRTEARRLLDLGCTLADVRAILVNPADAEAVTV